jgi:hypothetical protein
MTQFTARWDTLPTAQKRVWPDLKQVPRSFVLYGGTAIALRLGHRQSADFDFFSSEGFTTEHLLGSIPLLAESKILQSAAQTLTVSIQREEPVKVSFFGGLTIGRVGEPAETSDGVVLVASLLDLAGLKAAVIQQRAEAKDYLDLLALMDGGVSLASALGAAQALHGERYNPMVTLKALTYFRDGDVHTLTQQQQARLATAASEHLDIAEITRVADTISPPVPPR